MSRVPQSPDSRGSLKWIQRAVNQKTPRYIDKLILPHLKGARSISWRSPLLTDGYAEYRDAAFLEKIEASELSGELAKFWPARGLQWDALAVSDSGEILLIEAKAHLGEVCSPATGASEASLKIIEAALEETVSHLRVKPVAAWTKAFYQLSNRIAHLHFLRKHGRNANLVLVNFIGDSDMNGPATQAEWEAAYQMVRHVMGLGERHAYSKHIIHVYPDIAELSN